MFIIKKAKLFATKAHKGQYRKDMKTPYITHPNAVVDLLIEWGFDPENIYDVDTICAAYLHDTIEENKNISYLLLKEEFNKDIAEMVSKLTRNDYESKEEYINRLYSYDIADGITFGILLVKCADRICNIRDFINDGNISYAKEYYKMAEKIFTKLFSYITVNIVIRNMFNTLLQIN